MADALSIAMPRSHLKAMPPAASLRPVLPTSIFTQEVHQFSCFALQQHSNTLVDPFQTLL
jgi:hypothetical protein